MEEDVDDDILAVYRRDRLKQLQSEKVLYMILSPRWLMMRMTMQQEKNIFGSVFHVGQTDYKEAVTVASEKHTVIVHLMEHGY